MFENETWFVTQWGKIQECEVVRETKDFVVLPNGNREKKFNPTWRSYHKTHDEAVLFVIEEAQLSYTSAREVAEIELKKLNNLRNAHGKPIEIIGLSENINSGEGKPLPSMLDDLAELVEDFSPEATDAP